MDVAQVLATTRFSHTDEAGLQEAIAAALAGSFDADLKVEREVRIGPGERIDLLVIDEHAYTVTGIEVKVAGSTAMVIRQLRRYANSGRVDDLILVTTRVVHRELHGVTLSGVPVTVVVPAWL